MSRKTEDVLAEALAGVQSGRCSVKDALPVEPEGAGAKLEPLLRLALAIAPPAHADPSPVFKREARAGLLRAVRSESAASRTTHRVSWWEGIRLLIGRAFSPWPNAATLAATVLLAVVLTAATGAVYASQTSLPGDALYPVKASLDQAAVSLTTSDRARAEAYLSIVERRLTDIESLLRMDRRDLAGWLGEEVRKDLRVTAELIERVGTSGEGTGDLAERLRLATDRYEALRRALEARPGEPHEDGEHHGTPDADELAPVPSESTPTSVPAYGHESEEHHSEPSPAVAPPASPVPAGEADHEPTMTTHEPEIGPSHRDETAPAHHADDAIAPAAAQTPTATPVRSVSTPAPERHSRPAMTSTPSTSAPQAVPTPAPSHAGDGHSSPSMPSTRPPSSESHR